MDRRILISSEPMINSSTPLRALNFPTPRRLLFRDFEANHFSGRNQPYFKDLAKSLIQTPIFSVNRSPLQEFALQAAESTKYHPVPDYRVTSGDRFIPRRLGSDIDAAHYHHARELHKEKDSTYVDIFDEVKCATENWRRKHMDRAFRQENIFHSKKRILNIIEPSSSYKNTMESGMSDECQWRCRPRKKPLMNMKFDNPVSYRDYGAQIFRFAMSIHVRNLIDWGGKNCIAAGLADMLCICDVDFKHSSKIYRVDHDSLLCCVKWNNEGDKLIMCSMDGGTTLYDTNCFKVAWTKQCECLPEKPTSEMGFCKVNCIAWASRDRKVITGCSEGRLIVRNADSGKVITHQEICCQEVVAIALSPNEQHLAISGMDKLVKILNFPSLAPLFEIVFFTYVKALAWHPWTHGLLAIGGGPGDGAISLWNVNRQLQLGYRKVKFVGSIDYLMFNKVSGELIAHWYYLDEYKLRSKIVVLGSIDKVLDVVPTQIEDRMINIIWSPDHTKMGTQHRNALIIWNFFGSETENWKKTDNEDRIKKSKNNLRNYISDMNISKHIGPNSSIKATSLGGKNFEFYNIR